MTVLRSFEVHAMNGTYARRPTPEGGHVRVLAASTAETHSVPTDVNGKYAQYVLFSANCDFWVTTISSAEENIVLNGTFASDTSWTKGTGWSIGAGVATAAGAISTAISQTQASSLIVEGRSYSLTFTVTRTAGGIIPSIGGTAGTERTTSSTFTETIIAGSSQVIAFTGNGFTGTIDTITITPIAIVPADNSTGGGPDLNPTVYLLGGAYSKLSLITADSSGGTVGMQFYIL